MAIPRCNAYGLLPPGFHPATMAELQRKFGFSPKRHSLIGDGLKPVARELIEIGIWHLYVDGSFVTEKPSPGDIDGYILTNLDSDAYLEVAKRRDAWRAQYQLDIYPAATGIEGYGSQAFWEEWFGHTKDDPPIAKGIVKLSLKGVTAYVPDQE